MTIDATRRTLLKAGRIAAAIPLAGAHGRHAPYEYSTGNAKSRR